MRAVNLQRSDGNLARQDGSEIGVGLDLAQFHRLIKPIMRAPARVFMFQDDILRIRGDSSRQFQFFPMAKEVSQCAVSIPSQPCPLVFIAPHQFEVGVLRRASMVGGLEVSSQPFHRGSNIRVAKHGTLGNFLDDRARTLFVRAKGRRKNNHSVAVVTTTLPRAANSATFPSR
jgi:hypothetical protein